METSTATARPKPRLRGVSHLIAAIVAVPAAVLLSLHARDGSGMIAAIFGSAVVGLLSSSAIYHTPHWPPEKRMILRRLDRSMIYVLVAGSYTPFCWALGASVSSIILPVVWAVALLGMVKSIVWIQAPRFVTAIPYVLFGWAAVPYGSDLYAATGPLVMGLILVGGLLYTVGALAYARKWPDPVPVTFGYHEVFHVLVVAALGCHYWAVWLVVG